MKAEAPPVVDFKRLAQLAGAALVFLALIIFILHAAIIVGYPFVFLNAPCGGERLSLAEYGYQAEDVVITSADGFDLRGWYTPGSTHPDTAIIVLPGHTANTQFARADALILAEAGYGTLLVEHRSCAQQRRPGSTGYHEARDVLGAVEYLASRPEITKIGILGFSSGGTAAIFAAAEDPRLAAVVAQGGYDSLANDFLDPPASYSAYEAFVRQASLRSTAALIGAPVEAINPAGVIGQVSPRPVLLIYGEYEAEFGRRLYQAAEEPKSLWVVPGAGHGGYQSAAPQEYPQRIVAFFDEAFSLE